MSTYPLFALAVTFVAFIVDLYILRTALLYEPRTWKICGVILLITLIFDTFITRLPIVTYQIEHISGLFLGSIPVEDLSYPIASTVLTLSIARYVRRS